MSNGKSTTLKVIEGIEKRFREVSDLKVDMSVYPLKSNQISQAKTDKDKSKKFSEVFTPLWLVDAMIHRCKFHSSDKTTMDLCAGYGQFSVRLLRYFYNIYPDFNLNQFIRNNHYFSELQLESCYKLIYIFNVKLNLFIGDSTHLPKLPHNARGIWCYVESFGGWINLTKTVQQIFLPRGAKGGIVSEEKFVKILKTIINYYNHLYTHMIDSNKITLQLAKRDENTRLALLEHLKRSAEAIGYDDKNSQTIPTPIKMIDEMLDQVDDLEHKSVLVLFNAEFVERLIHKKGVDPSSITFVVDSDYSLLGEMVKKLYGVEVKTISGKNITLMRIFGGLKKYDVCLSNPPYNRGLDLKILQSLLGNGTKESSIANEYVWVHPAMWLLDRKNILPLYEETKLLVKKHLKYVNLFNGYAVFDAEGLAYCAIDHIDIGYNSDKINVSSFGKTFIASSINEITKFSSDWEQIVKPFWIRISGSVAQNGSIWSRNTKMIDPKLNYCQLAAIIGHTSKDPSVPVKGDFYTLTGRELSLNKGIRQPNLNRPGNPTPTFGFSSVEERDNFLDYVNTDFARFCLAILKNGKNAAVGEMDLIPWMDFTQPWNDEKLFAYFDIDQKTQDYIRSFLPDYYGIRKPVTKQVSTHASV
jgi:hypothetical protein